jgi:hypothetical protein
VLVRSLLQYDAGKVLSPGILFDSILTKLLEQQMQKWGEAKVEDTRVSVSTTTMLWVTRQGLQESPQRGHSSLHHFRFLRIC